MRLAPLKTEAARPMLTDRYYYLNNFRLVLSWLEDRYGDLLEEEQRRFIADFNALALPAQALLVRMATRKSDLFRASKLNYEEIGSSEAAAAPLIELGWIDDQSPITLDELFTLLRKDELLRLLDAPRAAATLHKPALLESLRPACRELPLLQTWYAQCGEKIYRLRAAALCERLRLMYFGNFHQTWSEFVLADLGVFRYERIDCSGNSRAFHSREQIDVFQQLYRCRERLHDDADPEQILREMPQAVQDSDWLEQRRAKLMFRIARRCEQRQKAGVAAGIYASCAHPGSALRAALIHERAQEPAKARAACIAGLQMPREAPDRDRFERVLSRLDRKTHGRPVARARNPIPDFAIIAPRPVPAASVEQAALEFLSASAADSSRLYYVENTLIVSLFGLLCWEAIFAPIPGAFFHPYQHGPADLHSLGFVERRGAQFASALDSLSSERYKEIILHNHLEKAGIQSPFVAWRALDQELLNTALECFPASHLRHWCEWILLDAHGNRAGFPDLVQFWPGERRYRLIEVKGPGDRLQENQRRLLEYCTSREMPVSVCHVRWKDQVTPARADP